MKFAVGTKNAAKLESVRVAVSKCTFVIGRKGDNSDSDGGECDGHERHEILGVETSSGVGHQPFTAEEGRSGALNRAKSALAKVDGADFGIGLEGSLEQVQGDTETYFECGWMCVVHASGRVGWGSSARFVLDDCMVQQLKAGKELATVIDEMTGQNDVRSNLGAMGILTGGALGRAEAYSHGLLFAFAPFLSPEKYWAASIKKLGATSTATAAGAGDAEQQQTTNTSSSSAAVASE